MKLVFFTPEFYEEKKDWGEMLFKHERPYLMLEITFDIAKCYIPFRSHIVHTNAFFTQPETSRAGLDFTKAIFLSLRDAEKYVSTDRRPTLAKEEYSYLRANEQFIKREMCRYIEEYKRAKGLTEIPAYATLVRYSTLQYFEEFIN